MMKFSVNWLDGQEIMSEEKVLLAILSAIQQQGSLSQATKSLGLSYRHAWGMLGKWQQKLGSPLFHGERGRGAQLTALGRKLLELDERVKQRLAASLVELSVELEGALASSMESPRLSLKICASHDLALTQLIEQVTSDNTLRIEIEFKGSLDSLVALNRRQCDLAGFHLPEAPDLANLSVQHFRKWINPEKHELIGFVRRQQGLMLAPQFTGKVQALADIARLKLRYVNRQRGSGTRLLFDQLLSAQGLSNAEIEGYRREEYTHGAVAATIASGMADAGFGIRAAAVQSGLGFVPLATENYYFLCRKGANKTPAIAKFIEVLGGAGFRLMASAQAGYDASTAGMPQDIAAIFPGGKTRIQKH